MADELTGIQDQMRRTFEGEAWHGPAVLEVLRGLEAEEAAARPVPGAHAIWEITLHLAANYRLVMRRVQGERASLCAAEDWPPLPLPTAEAWQSSLHALEELNEHVRDLVRGFPPDRLHAPLGPGSTSAYVHFLGLTQHDAYHAGQIALLRKALAASRRAS